MKPWDGADPADLELCTPDESRAIMLEFTTRAQTLGHALGCALAFWDSTDDEPLTGMTAEQGALWDRLCNALAVAEEWLPSVNRA